MSPWDRVWLDHTNLTHKRILVADNAVSAYKIDVMCTMMAGYDMVHGGVSESSTDEASRLWEEERISFRTSLFPTGQRRRPGKWPRGKLMDTEKEATEAKKFLSSFDKKTAAWKVQAEEAHKKISLLEKELQYRDAVNKLLSADIEVLTYAAKVPMGKEALALKQGFKDALIQVEFFQDPVKVNRSNVYPDQEIMFCCGGRPVIDYWFCFPYASDFLLCIFNSCRYMPRSEEISVECVKFESGLRPDIYQYMCVHEIRDFDTLVHKCRMFDDAGRVKANYYKAQNEKRGKSHGVGKPYNKDKGKKREDGGGSKPSLADVKCYRCGTLDAAVSNVKPKTYRKKGGSRIGDRRKALNDVTNKKTSSTYGSLISENEFNQRRYR
ncbi:hypothetical protein MTR_1g054270 [Medicago truncatula]|uniref:Uncharacterized protein n=1 Tax=Medicago truncatula TaxID=3880 RepID=A0A072VJE1_MEDTR|nr:hypothetical protein MTR_1g054270 [Medicago truncatula]